MKSFKIFLCVLLIAGHWSTELGAWLERRNSPEIKYVKPWLSNSYSFPERQGEPDNHISLYWWVTYNCLDILWCIVFFVMARLAFMYSFQLFLVSCIFFLYHCFDYFMLWYNFKSWGWSYKIAHVATFLAVVSLFIPDRKQAIIKSLK